MSNSNDMLRIWRHPYSKFGGLPSLEMGGLTDETIIANQIYDDKALGDIASSGFNAIWIHGLLHNIVSVEPFTELGPDSALHLKATRELIERAAEHGVKILIYMQPPRALPIAWCDFWKRHPDAGGQEENWSEEDGRTRLRALCTSSPDVRKWLVNAAAKLGGELERLCGLILITASEFPGHCYSHRSKYASDWLSPIECPRCRKRTPENVAAEVSALIERGLRSTAPDAEVIIWNWSWTWRMDSQRRVVMNLPEKAILMADFERGGVKDIIGKNRHVIDEYSLCYSGPSERFTRACGQAEARGMRTMAKLQLGTTHELASVVCLPLIGNIYDKADFIRQHNISGFMGCWNFGNFTSVNTYAFNYFLRDQRPLEKAAALRGFASHYFPGCDADKVVAAWELFQTAMDHLPFGIPFLYQGVQNFTLAFQAVCEPGPLTGLPSGGSWLRQSCRGDDLSAGLSKAFPLDDVISRLEKIAEIWHDGVRTLQMALEIVEAPQARLEFGNAFICGTIWRSASRSYRLYRLKKIWNDNSNTEFISIIKDEREDLISVLPYVEADPRQGYHSEAGCKMFDSASIRQKIYLIEQKIFPRTLLLDGQRNQSRRRHERDEPAKQNPARGR